MSRNSKIKQTLSLVASRQQRKQLLSKNKLSSKNSSNNLANSASSSSSSSSSNSAEHKHDDKERKDSSQMSNNSSNSHNGHTPQHGKPENQALLSNPDSEPGSAQSEAGKSLPFSVRFLSAACPLLFFALFVDAEDELDFDDNPGAWSEGDDLDEDPMEFVGRPRSHNVKIRVGQSLV
jgi:hypothetical protein